MADEQDRRLRIEWGRKWVRAYARGELVFDTTRPVLVWEVPYFPTYYVPREDVLAGLVGSGETKKVPEPRGRESYWISSLTGTPW